MFISSVSFFLELNNYFLILVSVAKILCLSVFKGFLKKRVLY